MICIFVFPDQPVKGKKIFALFHVHLTEVHFIDANCLHQKPPYIGAVLIQQRFPGLYVLKPSLLVLTVINPQSEI